MEQTVDDSRTAAYHLEWASRTVDKYVSNDGSAPTLLDVMNVTSQTGPTVSGLTDHDYPSLTGLPLTLSNFTQIKTSRKVPLPPEIMENFNRMQCHCMMGLFLEIGRAWLTIDSDIYLWTFEEGNDVAYFDGLSETIISVGLIKPKLGVFHSFIKYLLVLTTAVDTVVLGVTFASGANNLMEEVQLVPEPVFTIPTDGSTITTIVGTSLGRLFLGSKEGCLYEIYYQAESSWFGKRCKKINHSTSALSYLVPSFLNAALGEDDGIIQISVDNSRHILYTLSEKGSIEVYDLGTKGTSLSRITKLTQATLVQQSVNAVRTLESQNFWPIVNISAVEASDSGLINLVAISQTGVRFYFTVVGLTNLQPNERPYTLTLVHVRLPPGYSANVTTRPRMVHMANYRQRNTLFLSAVNESDSLWCLSSDMFPFSSVFMEAYTTIPVDGPAWAVAEVQYTHDSVQQKPDKLQLQPNPPLIVRQHSEPPRKYVVLTAQGSHIFMKLRPMDLLRDLLLNHNGPDNDIVRSFFMIENEDQACATSLILACLESTNNAEIAEWATRAFFKFGGEPKLAPVPILNQTNPYSGSSMFMPNIVSTPASGMPFRQQNIQPLTTPMLKQTQQNTFNVQSPFLFSSRHNGLYLYLGRILRPLWNLCCVEKLCTPDNTIFLTSSITADESSWILSYLVALRSFLQRNVQLSSCNVVIEKTVPQATFVASQQTLNVSRANQTIQDAQLEERQSLDAFKELVNHSCQVLGLWKILCEHQFHILVGSLPGTHQVALQNTTFKELILYGQEMCSMLIGSLINSYLGDNASIDSINEKLRDVCPNLFKNEDAACCKATELLKLAGSVQNMTEKEDIVAAALTMCKSVAPNFNLHGICQQFVSLNAYHAVADLCATSAKQVDPDNIAVHFYKNGEQRTDQEGYNYYARRMEIYKEMLLALENLYNQSNMNTTGIVASDIHNVKQPSGNVLVRQVINDILQYPDELLHTAVYEWMVSKKMDSDLIRITEKTLETYLVLASEQNPDNVSVLDLLWKYYESNNNHAAAAKVLHCLSTTTGTMLTLKDRLSYLARSIMCMRGDSIGYAPSLGVFLRDLEDKIEVVKVQEQILDAIENLRGVHPNAEEAIDALNTGLYDITQLYEDFADPFKLWECKLSIVSCAGYSDTALIERIWRNILQSELTQTSGAGNDRLNQILAKVKSLARKLRHSAQCFPLAFVVRELEIISAKLKADPCFVPTAMVEIDIAIDGLINIYNKLINLSTGDRFWSSEGHEFHLYQAFSGLICCFLSNHESYNNVEKRKTISLCQDSVASVLSKLYSKPNTEDLIHVLRGIQARLSRL